MAMAPRRVQRSRKLCEFHAKKPTGRTAVRFSRLPSTRQNTRSRASAAGAFCPVGTIFEMWSFGLDGNIVSGLLPIANEDTKLARQFPPIKPGGPLGEGDSLRRPHQSEVNSGTLRNSITWTLAMIGSSPSRYLSVNTAVQDL